MENQTKCEEAFYAGLTNKLTSSFNEAAFSLNLLLGQNFRIKGYPFYYKITSKGLFVKDWEGEWNPLYGNYVLNGLLSKELIIEKVFEVE